MFKQICFFKKRPGMTADEFMHYYEHQHSQLAAKLGRERTIAKAARYVRRYLQPELNPVTLEAHDPDYDCIVEIWWNSREDFEQARDIMQNEAGRLEAVMADENNLFASHANPVCSVIECDSPMGPNGEATHVELRYGD